MEQISNNGWKIIMRQWKVTGMVRKKGPWRGREMWTSQTCYTFLPSPALNVYLECLFGASGAAQIWLLFIKYLQWLAAFINKFSNTKKEVVLSPYYKEETGSERLGWLQRCSHLQFSSLHHLSTKVQSMLFFTISHYRFMPERR